MAGGPRAGFEPAWWRAMHPQQHLLSNLCLHRCPGTFGWTFGAGIGLVCDTSCAAGPHLGWPENLLPFNLSRAVTQCLSGGLTSQISSPFHGYGHGSKMLCSTLWRLQQGLCPEMGSFVTGFKKSRALVFLSIKEDLKFFLCTYRMK